MKQNFEMVAKTFQGLEDVLAEELRDLGAINVEPGLRMVSFEGNLEMMYRANLACRTALRILKPIYKFNASNTDELYDRIKAFDWSEILSLSKTFAIDPVVYSDIFTNSRFVTYRVKDAIVDYFKDKYGPDKRPGVRVTDADVLLNVHIAQDHITISLDSSGESLHKRGYRVAQTEAPINEVLAAGILLKSGWRGDTPLIDPMCGSGTFLIEAALIAANIMPGIYRRKFAFEQWKDFDGELLDSIYNDDSAEREVTNPIIGADISPAAVSVAERNIKSAGVGRYINISVKPFQNWTREEIPAEGVLVMNPPYGERIAVADMDNLYTTIGANLKHVFLGYHAWIIAYHEEYLRRIGLAPSQKVQLLNGALPCELREYIIFDGLMSDFRRNGGKLKPSQQMADDDDNDAARPRHKGARDDRRDRRDRRQARDSRGEGRRGDDRKWDDRKWDNKRANRHERKPGQRHDEPHNELERAYRPSKGRFADRKPRFADRDSVPEAPESENPLAKRRNVSALRSITGRKPSLPPATGVIMRKRRSGDSSER
ncbi:MAG: THUMP domain-containing protein [Candidatus Amulumruptor caecigallinarius]|nr:THUMP domain-containing protein [Candidatus Amulumruptor caecigallinarius]MCM1397380.1 THUMP domain-containing protein [Candidatus Amulumruptor caecigallinarius]MCM1454748.1 THUMP domain-containing protein [bacterium]